jgi:hypothetical protein
MSVDAVVEISLNVQQFTELETAVFTFFQEPQIVRAEQEQSSGAVSKYILNGGEPITVWGKKLRKEADLKCIHRTKSQLCQDTNCTDGVYVSALYIRSELMFCAAPDFPGQQPTPNSRVGSEESVLLLATNGFTAGVDEAEFYYYTPLDTRQTVQLFMASLIVFVLMSACCFIQYKRRALKNRKVVKIEEEWKRPSIDAADVHRHEVGIRKYGTRKYDWRKTSCDQLGELGEGIGLYFQFLKYFGQTFTIMAVLAIPAMIINSSGVSYSNKNINADPILKSTIGNIGGSADGTGNLVVLRLDQFNIYVDVPKHLVSLIVAALDAGMIFIFWLSYLNWRVFQEKVWLPDSTERTCDADDVSLPSHASVRATEVCVGCHRGLPRVPRSVSSSRLHASQRLKLASTSNSTRTRALRGRRDCSLLLLLALHCGSLYCWPLCEPPILSASPSPHTQTCQSSQQW